MRYSYSTLRIASECLGPLSPNRVRLTYVVYRSNLLRVQSTLQFPTSTSNANGIRFGLFGDYIPIRAPTGAFTRIMLLAASPVKDRFTELLHCHACGSTMDVVNVLTLR